METHRTIAIIGGGVSGALTAYHLVHRHVRAQIVLIDPQPNPGLGLAYSTPSYRHLLNVPAGRISAIPDQPDHFLKWLHKNHDTTITGSDFVPRAVFGCYIQSLLSAAHGVKHRQTLVVDAHVAGDHVGLDFADGTKLLADTVVLATGNFDPAPLRGIVEETVHTGSYCHSAWKDSTYANLAQDAPVVLIGTGLTAVDVLLRLRETGHRGQITAISRHGIFPNRHAGYKPLDTPVVTGLPPAKARELLHAVHNAIRSGMDWRAVIDSLRERTNELWLALPLIEQKRFRRHLQRRWDVVRHRMAPPVADLIDAELNAGTLVKLRGSLHSVLPSAMGARVQFRTEDALLREVEAARVINCTGPDMNYRRVGSPLLKSMLEKDLITSGPHGFGLWTSENGALRNETGASSDLLFHVGPGRQGTLLESIAVPELRHQAAELAELLLAKFGREEQTAYTGTAHINTKLSNALSRVDYELAI